MKVKKLIKELEKYNPNAEVKLHFASGNNLLFVSQFVGHDDAVILEDVTTSDLSSELDARFEEVLNKRLGELDFFKDLIDTGFTLEDIEQYLPEKYEYSKAFMKEHGLIQYILLAIWRL